jgi:hypothetical protein
MKNIDIKPEKRQPSANEVASTKQPFSQMLKQYQMIPKFKIFAQNNLKWLIGVSASVVVLAVIVVYLVVKPNTTEQTDPICKKDSTKCFIQPPLANIRINYDTSFTDNKKACAIETSTGTVIRVPENAFVCENGDAVTGPVTILYREFHNPIDIFLSGIPMRYDSAGVSNIFESAGMIDIRAFEGDKPLKLSEGKSLDIEMVSNDNDPGFNLYYLDTVKRNWVYVGKDKIVDNGPSGGKNITENSAKTVKSEPVVVIKSDFVKPMKADKSKNIFKVKYDEKQFPEFAIYQNIFFEVDESKSAFNKSWYKINWDMIALKRVSMENNLYEIKLQKRDSIVKLMSHAVINEKEYETAIKTYQSSTQPSKVTSRSQAAKPNMSDAMVADLKESINSRVTRSFSVFQLGTWNCDRPYPVPEMASFTQAVALVDDNTQKSVPCQQAYVVPLDMNMLLECSPDKLLYMENHECICFAVTPDAGIIIIDSEEFKKAFTKKKKEMHGKCYEPVAGIAELKKMVKV